MNKINTASRLVIGGVVVIILLFLVFVYGNSGSKTPPPTQSASSTANQTASSSATSTPNSSTTAASGTGTPQTTNPAVNPSSPQTYVPPPPLVIHIITPVANDQWQIGNSNPISWDTQPGITGEIDLLRGDGSFVGVILSQIGPHQTSYSWDTRDTFLARYNPLKEDVVPGDYMIQLKFDGNNLEPIRSPLFDIIN
jgi:hypothetical protein